jgi:hypothetical protein
VLQLTPNIDPSARAWNLLRCTWSKLVGRHGANQIVGLCTCGRCTINRPTIGVAMTAFLDRTGPVSPLETFAPPPRTWGPHHHIRRQSPTYATQSMRDSLRYSQLIAGSVFFALATRSSAQDTSTPQCLHWLAVQHVPCPLFPADGLRTLQP